MLPKTLYLYCTDTELFFVARQAELDSRFGCMSGCLLLVEPWRAGLKDPIVHLATVVLARCQEGVWAFLWRTKMGMCPHEAG